MNNSKQVTIIHPTANIPFRFYVASDAIAEDVIETLEVLVCRHFLTMRAMNMPIAWTDDIKAIERGARLREKYPDTYKDLLQQVRIGQGRYIQ